VNKDFFDLEPFGLSSSEKKKHLDSELNDLTRFHYLNCSEYEKIANTLGYNFDLDYDYRELPYLPVRLFKEYELASIPQYDVFKTLTSSGTTGQQVSKIFLDKNTASNQQKVLLRIVKDMLGLVRSPMIILDSPSVVKDKKMFSARGAGILGFSMFGTSRIYAFDEDMKINFSGIEEFLSKFKGQKIFLFGFTYMIWEYFYKKLKEAKVVLDLSEGVLLHGGGWKKLENEAVSKDTFKKKLNDVCKITRVHDYYGMVEQTGSVYMECEHGYLHCSVFSDVIIRNSYNFKECKTGEKGLVQVVSVLPRSYPGHSLLTEDEGVIVGVDDCSCGRKGKYFSILGRVKLAEVRGCSDTFERP
jgi:phenylacetate-coenzyme A ligase PaaK-like adenylate-forming protein